jgi:uncharacterized repeat protein (TIGR04076 family)
MAFKVRAKMIGFFSDEEKYPCHFDYKVGDEIYYDGGIFEGRVCPGLINTLIPVLKTMVDSGTTHYQKMLFRKHGGPSVKDCSMKEHDGIGFRMLDKPPDDLEKKFFVPVERGVVVCCEDIRTLAAFSVEPVDLSSGGFYIGDYRRQMEIMQKIKDKPGMTLDDIMGQFSDEERKLYVRLSPEFVEAALEEMEKVKYIELRNGRAYALK